MTYSWQTHQRWAQYRDYTLSDRHVPIVGLKDTRPPPPIIRLFGGIGLLIGVATLLAWWWG